MQKAIPSTTDCLVASRYNCTACTDEPRGEIQLILLESRNRVVDLSWRDVRWLFDNSVRDSGPRACPVETKRPREATPRGPRED